MGGRTRIQYAQGPPWTGDVAVYLVLMVRGVDSVVTIILKALEPGGELCGSYYRSSRTYHSLCLVVVCFKGTDCNTLYTVVGVISGVW